MYNYQTKKEGVKQLIGYGKTEEEAWEIVEELDRKHTIELKKKIKRVSNKLKCHTIDK